MAYDSAGFQPAVKPALTERAAFAADLAKHANEPYGVRGDLTDCALGRFFGGAHDYPLAPRDAAPWQEQFARAYDQRPRQPTGYDCLAILQSIPA